ncbi:MAG: hypothetical protein E7013_04475 [Alphaproteobacteria bacterium]|nr:hypothetical protein [Alphaproteobacteria bacterium]
MRIDENDYTYEELTQAIQKQDFDTFQAKITLTSHPERFIKHIQPAIEKQDVQTFKFLMLSQDLFDIYESENKQNIWECMVQTNNLAFIGSILESCKKRPFESITPLIQIQNALTHGETNSQDEYKSNLYADTQNLQRLFILRAAQDEDGVIIANKTKKGDFPDISFTTYQYTPYHFKNLSEIDFYQQGLSNYLQKMIHQHKSQMIEDIVSLEEKNKWVEDNFADDVDEFPNIGEEPLTSRETVEKIKSITYDLENFYNKEFQKLDSFYFMYRKIKESRHKGLLNFFVTRGGRFVFQRDEGQKKDFATADRVISIKDVNFQNIYCALIEEIDGPQQRLSKAPLFRALKKHMIEQTPDNKELKEKALLPYLAQRSMDFENLIPSSQQRALDIVDNFAVALSEKRLLDLKYILTELDKVPENISEKSLETQMKKISNIYPNSGYRGNER